MINILSDNFKHNVLSLLSTFLLIFGLSTTVNAKTFIFACEQEWASLSKEIGQEHIEVFAAVSASQDPHYLRAKPSLMSRIRKADLVVCSGASLEVGWLPLVLQKGQVQVQPGNIGNIEVAQHVDLIEKSDVYDRSLGDVHPEGNPHSHLDPDVILGAAAVIANRLAAIDPENKNSYETNLNLFEERWRSAVARWTDLAAPLNGKNVVIYHKSFSYLLRFLNMEASASIEPKPGISPSTGDLAKLVNRVNSMEDRPLAIILAPHEPRKAGEWLSDKVGLDILALPFTAGGTAETKDLFDLYEISISLLLEKIE